MARTIEAFGEKKTISAWAKDDRCAVSYSTLYNRLKDGEDPESAIKRKGPGKGRPAKADVEKGNHIHMWVDGESYAFLRELQARDEDSVDLAAKRLLLERLEQLKEESDQ